MYCQKCGQQIENTVQVCPHCGATVNAANGKPKKPFYRRWWFCVIVVLIVLYVIGTIGESSVPTSNPVSSTPTTQAHPSTGSPTGLSTAPTETTQAPAETTAGITVYDSGMYKIGVDIEAGEYFVTSDWGQWAYVEVTSDSSGSFDSIVANENVNTFYFITVSDGQYLKVEDGSFVKAEDADVPGPDANGVYGEGMYRVGIDVPAGEFKITPKSGSSVYVEVTSDSLGSMRSIVSNDYSESSIYISAANGQYIKVGDGQFIPAS